MNDRDGGKESEKNKKGRMNDRDGGVESEKNKRGEDE